MRNLNVKPFVGALAVVSVLALVIAAAIQGFDLKNFWTLTKLVPTVITVDWVAYLLFTRWAWRWNIWHWKSWLVPFPDLSETWEGHIQTNWKDAQGNRASPIPTNLTIKQSFSRISCVMRTGEMESHSYVEGFCIDPENQVRRLWYSYTSKPKLAVRDRSPLHDGTILLNILGNPAQKLEGEYWTQRQTSGTVALTFRTKDRLDELPSDLPRHPMSPHT